MRTRNYRDNLNDILTLCMNSRSALVVAEINDSPTRADFEADLCNSMSAAVLAYHKLNTNLFLSNVNLDKSAFVLTGVINEDSNIAEYLNLNRDFFLNIGIPVIFILPSFAVDSLISFSSSFWSCISTHKKFTPAFRSLLQPRFIDNVDLKHTNSMNLSYILGRSVYIENRESLRLFLHNEWKKIKRPNEPASFFRELRGVIEYYYLKQKYYYVIDCCEFIDACYEYDAENERFLFVFWEYYANSLYHIGEYRRALEILNKILAQTGDFKELNSSMASRCLNNLGVLLMISEGYVLAETVFKRSSSVETQGVSLYNLSLLAYNVGQVNSALDTIQTAKTSIPVVDSDGYKTAIARMQVLEAYIQVNRGNCKTAKSLLQVSLDFFRDKFDEYCLYVLETHYTNALVYLYEGDYSGALKCAKSAYNIATKLKSFLIRPYISELVGEIYFLLGNLNEASRFLSEALQKNTNYKYFDEDISEWITDIVRMCTKQRQAGSEIQEG